MLGIKSFDFMFPVEQETRGQDHQMRSFYAFGWGDDAFLDAGQHTHGLQSFSQTHIVGQTGPQPVPVQKGQPMVAFLLIMPKGGPQVPREWKGLNPFKV